MELVKNIFFNTDKLVANNTVKISYTGVLFQNGATQISIRYGFGEDWEDQATVEMVKTELGFQTEIELLDKGCLNFCLKDENDNWDNNKGTNYSFEIEHPELALVVVNQEKSVRRLRKTYIWSKKIKIAVYKMLVYIPKLLTGNFKRKVNN